MKKILCTLILFLSMPVLGFTQTTAAYTAPYSGTVAVSLLPYTSDGDQIIFRATVDFSRLDLSARQMIELTPVLRSTVSSQELRFAPVVISGNQRARIVERAEYFGDYKRAAKPSEIIVLNRKNSTQTHEIAVSATFEKWMRHSELVLVETTIGCGNRQQEYSAGVMSRIYSTTPYTFPAPYQPVYTAAYIVPEVEPVKTASESHSARLQFSSGKSNLVAGLGNNAQELDKVDQVIGNIKQDSLLTIKGIRITGYSSPDGSVSSNTKLAFNRANELARYLQTQHNYRAADRVISVEGMGEDWAGLRKAVESSGIAVFADRDAVLAAIDNNTDPDRRERAIRAIGGGRAWRTLTEDFFPYLRRNEYSIEYEVRGLNAEEAQKVIWLRPNLLSLNEMFMVSQLYDPSSQEYKDIFHTAVKMYPESTVASLNTAAMEVQSGQYDSAIGRLLKIDTPESWNNLGIAYWYKGEYEKALGYFQRAADAGSDIAKENLRQYGLWFEDKD